MAVFSDGGSQQSSTVTKLTVIEESYSSIDNSSVVSWKLTMSVAGWNFSGWSVTSKVWLDGSLIYNSSKTVSIGKNSTVTLASGTKTIYHNDNGSKTISCKAETSTSTSASYLPGKATPQGELKLTDIPRNAKFDVTGWDTSERPVENEVIFKIIKPTEDYYCELSIDSQQFQNLVTRANIENGEYHFQFTQDELNNIVYPFMTSDQVRTVVAKLRTYEDSTKEVQIGEEVGIWYRATIENANPIFNDFEYEDSNSITTVLTNDSNKIVKGYSTLKVTIPVENKAIGQKGATITGYTIDNYSVAYSDSEDVIKEIPNYQNESIVVSAVDSRGNSKSITKLFTDNLINYTDLVMLSFEVFREDEIGEKVKIKFNGTWWPANFGGANGGGILNELVASYQYQTGNGEWINGTSTLTLDISEFGKFSCEQYIVGDTGNGFNISNSYNIRIIVSDKLSSRENTRQLIAGSPAIALYGNNIALHGKYDESKTDIPVQIYGNLGDITVNSINGKNLFNKNNLILGYYLDYDSGQPVADSNMCYTNYYIEVSSNDAYTMSNSYATIFTIHYYDVNKNWLGCNNQNNNLSSYTVNIINKAKYVRLSCGKSTIGTIQFEKGSKATEYSEYKLFDCTFLTEPAEKIFEGQITTGTTYNFTKSLANYREICFVFNTEVKTLTLDMFKNICSYYPGTLKLMGYESETNSALIGCSLDYISDTQFECKFCGFIYFSNSKWTSTSYSLLVYGVK